MLELTPPGSASGWRKKLYRIIFEADTPAGKAFDIALLWAIILSVTVVFLESIQSLKLQFGNIFYILEWCFTILFTIEYVLRLICVNRSIRYARSFFGIVDLLAILPTYISLLIAGSQYLLVIRILRLLRVFRIFKLTHFIKQADVLKRALAASRLKITVFLFAVLSIVVIIGALMYVIEGPEHGFINIPTSIYWTIVTLTTVGYGDISPQTPVGQFLASIVMLTGYAIIAVPTGIVSVEIAEATRRSAQLRVCPNCLREGHDIDAIHCKYCGHELNN
jgi:voltage-gated potassium channel